MRRLLILALLLLAPAAAAQLPVQPSPCGPLQVFDPVPPPALAPGAEGSITIGVRNNGNAAADVTVAASTTTPGWSIVSSTDQTARVNAGQQQDFTFTVAPDETATDAATVTFATTAGCVNPTGQCPSAQLCQAQGEAKTVTVGLAPREGFRIPGLGSLDAPLPYLLAGVLLIGGAAAVPLLLRKRRPPRATAACPEPLKPIHAGKGASFPIEVINPADQPRKVHLEVGPVPEGWSAFLPLPEVQLAAKETRSLWLMVRAPPHAAPGDAADVEVTARDAGRPERPTVVKVRAEVEAEGAPQL